MGLPLPLNAGVTNGNGRAGFPLVLNYYIVGVKDVLWKHSVNVLLFFWLIMNKLSHLFYFLTAVFPEAFPVLVHCGKKHGGAKL